MKAALRYEFAYPSTIMFKADEQFLFGREPTPRRMPDGSIISFVFTGGSYEPHPDNVAAMIRSTDDGETWSKPEIVFRHPFRATMGSEIFTEGNRPFAIFETFPDKTCERELRSFLSFTDDCGKTWSSPRSIPGVPPNFNVRQGKVLSDGSWIFPVHWVEQRSNWTIAGGILADGGAGSHFISGVIRSTDGGKMFSLHGAISTPSHAMEPEVTELEPGHLKMFVRCAHGDAVLWESESFDFGRSWREAQPTLIPNPSAKFVIYKIRGRHVLINNVCTELGDRKCLELWVSSDQCASWSKKLPLAKVRMEESAKKWNTYIPPQVTYPHGFADDAAEKLYLAVDSIEEFHFLKIPYSDFL